MKIIYVLYLGGCKEEMTLFFSPSFEFFSKIMWEIVKVTCAIKVVM